MAWDFTVDSDIQLEMAKTLKSNADELDVQFENLYTQIGPNNLGTHWVGSDYDLFYTGCEGYKVALADLTDSIRMYASHFEKIADGTNNLSSACISIVQNMTTRGTVTVGQNGTVTQGNNTQNGTNNNGGATNNNGGTTNNNGGTTNNNGGTTNNNGGTTNNNGGTTNNNQENSNGNNSGQSNVTGVWKSYQDAADAGYPNIKTAHEFARGGYDKEKYGTYDNYLAAMQERYVGSTYEQDTSGSRANGNGNGTTNATTNNSNTNGINNTQQNVTPGNVPDYAQQNVTPGNIPDDTQQNVTPGNVSNDSQDTGVNGVGSDSEVDANVNNTRNVNQTVGEVNNDSYQNETNASGVGSTGGEAMYVGATSQNTNQSVNSGNGGSGSVNKTSASSNGQSTSEYSNAGISSNQGTSSTKGTGQTSTNGYSNVNNSSNQTTSSSNGGGHVTTRSEMVDTLESRPEIDSTDQSVNETIIEDGGNVDISDSTLGTDNTINGDITAITDSLTNGDIMGAVGIAANAGMSGMTNFLSQNGLPPETWSDAGAAAGLAVGGGAGAIVGGAVGKVISSVDSNLDLAPTGAAAGFLLGGVPSAVGGAIVGKTLEGYATGQLSIPFINNGYYGTVMQDFSANFNYSNCASIEDFARTTLTGMYGSKDVVIQFAGNVFTDVTQSMIDTANYSIFNRNDGYWETLNNDFSQNIDFSNAANLSDAVLQTSSVVADKFWGPEGAPINENFDMRQAASNFLLFWNNDIEKVNE